MPFWVFFDAEVKVELTFDAPLVIDDGAVQVVTVFVNPAAWFAAPDGSVLDLSAFDFGATGQLFKLEAKFLDGFTKIEVD